MLDTFLEYKVIIDRNMMKVDYIYSGDVISSISPNYYSEVKQSSQTSPMFIIKCIEKIYMDSFDIIKNKAIDIIISDIDLYNKVNSNLNLNTKYIFASNSSYYKIRDNVTPPTNTNTSSLPSYFFQKGNLQNSKLFLSPCVEESLDRCVLYGVDNAFQSMVYVLQNMEYTIIKIGGNKWEHRINYQLYDCKFSSTRLIIQNISEFRDTKIDDILS